MVDLAQGKGLGGSCRGTELGQEQGKAPAQGMGPTLAPVPALVQRTRGAS